MKLSNKDVQPKLSQRINRLRWQVPVLAFLVVLVHQLLEHTWLWSLPHWRHFVTQIVFYGLIGPVLVWWALTLLHRRADETEAAHQALNQAHNELEDANQRLELLIRVNRQLAEADDEEALIDVMLTLPLEVVPAVGCSLIRLDERGQPLPVVHQGELDPELLETWSTQLSASEVYRSCERCTTQWATEITACPLLNVLPAVIEHSQVYCLTLSRGEYKYGVLNIYLPNSIPPPDLRTRVLLTAMAGEMSLAIESHYLRSRELAALYRLQQARRLSNLHVDLTEVLIHIVEALEVDGGNLFLADTKTGQLDLLTEAGQTLGTNLPVVQGLAASVKQTNSPMVIGDFKQEGNGSETLRSLLIAPLCSQGRFLGSLTLWSVQPDMFTRRRTQLVATVAEQMALLVENQRLYTQVEQQAALTERARLAREIHDGLAQTLSYLKLRTARIAKWLSAGEAERAKVGLNEVQDLLGEAYVDAREAIDDLRLKPGSEKCHQWLEQTLADFQSLSTIQVETDLQLEVDLPLEVQTQLLRIVQEALSNVRKYAEATLVRVDCRVDEQWLTLCIADNGRGFEPADVPPLSRHGLKIMQERAELLDADFQIISCPKTGTQVVVRLPLSQLERVG